MRFLSSVSFQAYIWHHPLALQLKYWRFPAYSAPSNPQFYSETVWQRHYTLVCFLGALLLATLHAGSLEDIKKRPGLRPLLQEGLFDQAVLLPGPGEPPILYGEDALCNG